ncbi:MobF family relaxase [Corynebacterium bovis]|uniref:MobF family relaxase n=1 Tax=Corynebacterium bovis TaxID=36808 RepID=UPI001639935F|nr:MobF family relaxase [Corynebacterium bovis]
MMSIRVAHAGEGYRYLLRSVATNDADPDAQNTAEATSAVEGGSPTGQVEAGDRLSAYYQAKGTPPGRWCGRGVAGLASETVTAGAQVTEDQMAALYGEGLHPDADARIGSGESVKDVQLGRKFSIYTGGHAVLADLAAAEKSFRADHDRRPTEAERGELALSVGRAHFAGAHDGQAPADGKEVISWVNRLQDSTPQAVSGFDLTFSPVKSVSVLWGLADEKTSNVIAAAHHDAVAHALEWVQDNALFTRLGINGIQQVKTDGVIAAEFTHFDTRSGDPDLHSHVLVSNKVRVSDTPAARAAGKVGQWKTIHSAALFERVQNASGVYNTTLQQLLSERLGLEFTAVSRGSSAEPVWEVAGVPRSLNEAFSSRRAGAKPVYERMVADYVERHGRQPSSRVNYRLWQAAILETRDAKRPAESLDDLREQWREQAGKIVPSATLDELADRVTGVGVPRPAFSVDVVDQVAAKAIDATLTRRATFKRSHVHTAVSQLLRGYRFDSTSALLSAHDAVMDTAMGRMAVCLTPPEVLDLPAALVDDHGVGIDRRVNAEIYSTTCHLDRERAILAAAETPVPVFVPTADIDTAVDRFTHTRGFSLNTGQVQMARHFLTCGTQLAVAVGPAGTGKTTSMKLVSDLWKHHGRAVIGLAPSAAAATVLEGDIGTRCYTIDSLTHAWNRAGNDGLTGADRVAMLPVQITHGDMLLVDEAGMASTNRMADLVDIARATGAVIRMVGDPAQLDAVETGGMFRTLARTPGTPQLVEVMRFGDDSEMTQASLSLRDGDTSGLDVLFDRGWVSDGTRETMLSSAVQGYLTDTAAGRTSLCIASTNADVTAMNEMIQHARQAAGRVADSGPSARLSDGLDAHIGDTILARKNTLLAAPEADSTGVDDDASGAAGRGTAAGVRVLNGQRLHVRAIRADGSLDTFDPQTKTRVHLPAEYVAGHTQLGYASTAHRAQGATVDTAHAVIDPSMDRNSAYVALTRHKTQARIYVDTTPTVDVTAEDAHQHHSGDTHAPTPRDVLEAVVGRDTAQRSATDALHKQFTQASNPDRVHALYLDGVDRATRYFTTTTTRTLIETLPVYQAAALEADTDGYEAVEHAISHAANHGVDPRHLWVEASDDIDWADSPGRLIASRIRHMTGVDHAETGSGSLPAPPPVIPGADMELACWLEQTHTQLTAPTDAQTTATADPADEATMLDWLADRGITDTTTGTQDERNPQPHQHRPTRPGRPATNPSGAIPLTGPAAAAAAFGSQATTIGTNTNDRIDETNKPLAHNRDSIDDQFGLDRLPWLNDDTSGYDEPTCAEPTSTESISEEEIHDLFNEVLEENVPGWNDPDNVNESDSSEIDIAALLDEVIEEHLHEAPAPKRGLATETGYEHNTTDHDLDTGYDL